MVKKTIKLKVDSEYLIYDLQEVFNSAIELLMPESELKKKMTESFLKEFEGENKLINPFKPKTEEKESGIIPCPDIKNMDEEIEKHSFKQQVARSRKNQKDLSDFKPKFIPNDS